MLRKSLAEFAPDNQVLQVTMRCGGPRTSAPPLNRSGPDNRKQEKSRLMPSWSRTEDRSSPCDCCCSFNDLLGLPFPSPIA